MSAENIRNGVILAENDIVMRDIIRSLLLRVEQLVFPAADGLEALMLARQFTARLVLLDIAMPRLNGLLACEAIRALPGYAEVPIVMLTGHDDARFRLAARRFGAVEFITKPFRPNALLTHLAAYIDIPPHLLPAAPKAWDTEVDPATGSPAQVWKLYSPRRPAQAGDAELDHGREVVRIVREAERKS